VGNHHWNERYRREIGGAGSGRTPIIGAVQRKRNVVTRVLNGVTAPAALSFVQEVVSDKVSLLAIDTLHKVSANYMPLYVAECQFRCNNRTNSEIFGSVIGGC
jgi:hypothetical protein